MDYEQKYKEALEKAKEFYILCKKCRAKDTIDFLEDSFSELKESEDEKIKNKLINLIKMSSEVGGLALHKWEADEMLTWLKKQGKQKSIDSKFIRMSETKPKDISEFLDRLTNVEQEFLWEHIAKIRKLDKEEQKPADKVKPKFKHGDRVRNKKSGLEQTLGSCIEDVYDGAFPFRIKDQEDWELVEQPADKVEPKFKNGQWIVWQDKCYKVNYNGCGYELVDQNGLSTSLEYGTIDENAHLWTIQDAKPCDVIYLPNGNNEYYFFIFKGIENAAVMSFAHFYQYNDGSSEVEGTITYLSSVNDVFQPATKEQHDILFQKMHEKGYEWNAEKKELKEIIDEKQIKKNLQDNRFRRMFEQKYTLSEEDDNCLSTIIAEFSKCAGKSVSKDKWIRCNDFLNSLEERIKSQQIKIILSEKDEDYINDLIKYFSQNEKLKNTKEDIVIWLKSLKRCNEED